MSEVSKFVTPGSWLYGESSDAKIYIGCVSKMGETRMSCGLGRDWNRKTKQKLLRVRLGI